VEASEMEAGGEGGREKDQYIYVYIEGQKDQYKYDQRGININMALNALICKAKESSFKNIK